MGENSPENVIYYEVEENDLVQVDKPLRFVDKNGLVPSSSRMVYDRTTVLIEQDQGPLEDEEDEGQCGDHLPFFTDGHEDRFHLIADPEGMSQGYVQHIISPDQIHLTINPGSTPMPRNIEGATLTLQSECPETKLKEVSNRLESSHFLLSEGHWNMQCVGVTFCGMGSPLYLKMHNQMKCCILVFIFSLRLTIAFLQACSFIREEGPSFPS